MARQRDLALYILQSSGEFSFIITKYDSLGFEMLSQYTLVISEAGSIPACDCPQAHAPSCRHRKMFPMMVERADKPWFFCYDTGEWKAMAQGEFEQMMDGDRELRADHLTDAEAPGPGDDNGAAKPYKEPETISNPLPAAQQTGKDNLVRGQVDALMAQPPKPMRRL